MFTESPHECGNDGVDIYFEEDRIYSSTSDLLENNNISEIHMSISLEDENILREYESDNSPIIQIQYQYDIDEDEFISTQSDDRIISTKELKEDKEYDFSISVLFYSVNETIIFQSTIEGIFYADGSEHINIIIEDIEEYPFLEYIEHNERTKTIKIFEVSLTFQLDVWCD